MSPEAQVIQLPPAPKEEKAKRRGPPKGTKLPKWTPERLAKFQRTMRRKRREHERAAREATRKGRTGRKPIGRPRAAGAALQPSKRYPLAAIGPHTRAAMPGSPRAAIEGTPDAIAYLRAATEGYEAIPTSVCYSLLALRRLLGQIK